ncbi:hypothetical protein [Hymenobacter siberiensis]|uniref:hypothetical protein n=1 Tax=Hymenobacter siberiensis TaxID=2848396 RepID=UPI001D00CA45|nr:hypothetical protein [Hymenobacter siberiensis]
MADEAEPGVQLTAGGHWAFDNNDVNNNNAGHNKAFFINSLPIQVKYTNSHTVKLFRKSKDSQKSVKFEM